jgi:hypothetical protein
VGRAVRIPCPEGGPFVDAGTRPAVWVCHPFLVHAASWPHRGPRPRIIAQPAVALHDQFPLTAPLSPVEQTIAR